MFKKIILLIVILGTFSCSGNLDKELEFAFKDKNIKKIQILLKKYKKKFGYNNKYEFYNIKLEIFKNNYEKALDYYNNALYMKNIKNEYIDKVFTGFFIEKSKKKDIKYIKNLVKKLPYSSRFRKYYLGRKWKDYFNFDTAVNDIRNYRNDFKHDKELFLKFVFYYLFNAYKKNKDIKYLKEIAKIDIIESRNFIENLIDKKPYLINIFKKLPSIKIRYIEKLLNSDFENKKMLIKRYLKSKKLKDLKFIYEKANDNNKISIYFYYHKLYNNELDENLINYLISKNKIEYLNPALTLIEDLKLKKYKNTLVTLIKNNKFENHIEKIVKTILQFDANFLKNNPNIKLSDNELKEINSHKKANDKTIIKEKNKIEFSNKFKTLLNELDKNYDYAIFDLMSYLKYNIKKEQISFLIKKLKIIDYYWLLGTYTSKEIREEIIINILNNFLEKE